MTNIRRLSGTIEVQRTVQPYPVKNPFTKRILGIVFLVAVGALHGRGLAVAILGFVAGDAQSGGGSGIVECCLEANCHWRSGRFGVAIGAGLLR